ncbi:hypothetical protein F4810DRAFT_647356 [Camillea tinctor]|nr:hypothetical protein F4810DRAFT_647356 [Camillea tinctor]
MEELNILVEQMNINVTGFINNPGAESRVLIDIHDNSQIKRVERLFERLCKYPEGSLYRDLWNRRRTRPESGTTFNHLALDEATLCGCIPAPSNSAKKHTDHWTSIWKELAQGDEHPRPIPKFRQVCMIKIHRSILEGLGLDDFIFEC